LLIEEIKNTVIELDVASKLQAEKTEEISKYLQKPGISRLFKGMGKDKNHETVK
jgi:hypothetical protein